MLPDEAELHGGRLVRAIVTTGDLCRHIVQDGREMAMYPRASPVHAAFPVLLCEAKLAGTSDAWIGGRRLPVRSEDPRDIVVIGDTGCRMVHYDRDPQRCLSGIDWPFAAVAASAATAIASSRAVVIHVGDYHYRENPCADASPACGGSPYGDNWATW